MMHILTSAKFVGAKAYAVAAPAPFSFIDLKFDPRLGGVGRTASFVNALASGIRLHGAPL
jgi:hypothetical protein